MISNKALDDLLRRATPGPWELYWDEAKDRWSIRSLSQASARSSVMFGVPIEVDVSDRRLMALAWSLGAEVAAWREKYGSL